MSTSRNGDITVVVVNYNYGRYLTEALDSARRQKGGPPQLIVVDDGSTDAYTRQVLTQLESTAEDVRVVRQENGGASSARNLGIRSTETPLILLLDADDVLPDDALAGMRAALDADPALGFAYGHPEFFEDMSGVMRMPPFDPYRLLYRHLIGATALVRTDVLRQVGGYDPAFKAYEDWDIWLAAIAAGWRGERVDQVTNRYRRKHDGKYHADRAAYRESRRRMRAKYADLFARRRELARESDLGLGGLLAYRWFWGPRPLPAVLERQLQTWYFRQHKSSEVESNDAQA